MPVGYRVHRALHRALTGRGGGPRSAQQIQTERTMRGAQHSTDNRRPVHGGAGRTNAEPVHEQSDGKGSDIPGY